MKKFLREYWLYVVAPFVIVIVLIIVLALTSDGPASPFNYNW